MLSVTGFLVRPVDLERPFIVAVATMPPQLGVVGVRNKVPFVHDLIAMRANRIVAGLHAELS